MLDDDLCYQALTQRNPAADGHFFVAVRTTRIFCRPICPARLPLRRNVLFFQTAAQAQDAGFRPCLRCRPESAPHSPAWIGSLASINRALRLIDEGALTEGGPRELALRLGMSDRHLRRLFEEHLGISPSAVERARRVSLAKQLIHETGLSLTEIAFASGFGSVRRFNEVFANMFGRPPSSLRRQNILAGQDEAITIRIWHRPSFGRQEWMSQAAEVGYRIEGDAVEMMLDLDGAGIRASVLPSTGRTSLVTLHGAPIRLLGRAIAEAKLAMASAGSDRSSSGREWHIDAVLAAEDAPARLQRPPSAPAHSQALGSPSLTMSSLRRSA